MLLNIKALIVVLVLSLGAFHLARPICLAYMDAQAFDRRRNIWLSLTSVAFLSPVFWTYALVALIVLAVAARHDDNPLALYVLMTFTIPNASFQLPAILVNQLFDLTQYRLLFFAIVLTAIVYRDEKLGGDPRLRTADVLMIASALLQLVLFMKFESTTATMRRAFLFTIDGVLPVYAFTRLWDRTRIAEVVVSFWLSCVLMAPVAIFEWGRHWLLYTGLVDLWGDTNAFAWLFRGDSLRAQAATGHSLNLGYVLAVGLTLYLAIRQGVDRKLRDWACIGLLAMGIFVSGARSAWLTAMLGVLVYMILRPGSFKNMARLASIGGLALVCAYLTPLRESLIDRLPFIGSAEQGTVEYRQQLAETSWMLIKENFFLGDPFVYLRMESLRQGQGIIDIVNGYLFTALFSGVIGLFLQISIYLLALGYGMRAVWARRRDGSGGDSLSAALLAALAASMFYIAASGYAPTMYILAGLLIAAWHASSYRVEPEVLPPARAWVAQGRR